MTCRWFVLGLAIVTACASHKKGAGDDAGTGSDGDGGGPLPHDLIGITVTPTNPLVELDLNVPGSQPFTATGQFADGVDQDITSQVTWTVANPAVGTITAATLAIPGFAAATAVTSTVTADFVGITGKAQITVVAYRQSGPQQDFFFILPYQDPAGAINKPLNFSTNIPALDVFFLMDTTGSMAGEIANLKSALTNTIVPGIQNAVANSQFGVGSMQDFPIAPYGTANCSAANQPDQPLRLLQPITSSTSAVQAGVSALSTANGQPIGCGNDWPEGGIESIYQAATGNGLSSPAPTNIPANHTGIGGVGFRAGTMPVVVTITDAMSHGPGESASCVIFGQTQTLPYGGAVAAVAHSRAQTKTALANVCARVVGVAAIQTAYPAACSGQEYLEDFATSTGARVPPAAWDVGVRPAGCAANQCCTDYNGAGRA
ncbi:MAG: hypothetical protein JWO36_1274, partial [Myxococcales bacterium]|nr:hypothetical protein [Myxococcales bacterium]